MQNAKMQNANALHVSTSDIGYVQNSKNEGEIYKNSTGMSGSLLKGVLI